MALCLVGCVSNQREAEGASGRERLADGSAESGTFETAAEDGEELQRSDEGEKTEGNESGETAANGLSVLEKVVEGAAGQDEEEEQARRLSLGLDEQGMERLRKEQSGRYDFEALPAEAQDAYVEIYATLVNSETDVLLSTRDPELVAEAFACVLDDHPEIFYVDGYALTRHTLGGEISKLNFSGSYVYNPAEIAARQKEIDAYVKKALSAAPVTIDEYEKVKYVYEYLIEHTEYEPEAEDGQNICSVFRQGKSVCQGYAKATQYLLGRLGVNSTLVKGTVKGGTGHAWNLVRINGEYYYVDTTWGDASYETRESSSGYEGRLPSINYDYLCIPTGQLVKTHAIDNQVPMPECTSMNANYYVREGAYFLTVEEEKLRTLFARSAERADGFIALKGADEEVYRLLKQYLIHEQKVFKYMQTRDGTIAYTVNEEQLSLSFWL